MLDPAILDQLKSHFSNLATHITFVVYKSHHDKQAELLELLEAVAALDDGISIRQVPEFVPKVQFDLHRDGVDTGIRFRGIPGGHEFTSFVLAILNAAGKGKLPDAATQERITALKNPAPLSTYVSLSCENCPDVIQALNLIALYHKGFRHEMVDGDLFADEVKNLRLGGVPAVVSGGKILHSGKANLGQLLTTLEEAFGSDRAAAGPQDLGHFDVAVIGGGPAGAAAAIYSARKGLKTAVIAEKLGGQVQETKGIENLISVVYTEGPKLAAGLEQHMKAYDISLLEHRRVNKITVSGATKAIALASQETLTAAAVIIATGAKWRELNIPGEKTYLGRGVAYCPHCDGPYYKNRKVAVIGGGNSGVEAAIDLAGICSEVVLFEFMDQLKADDVLIKKLTSLSNVSVKTSVRAATVEGDGTVVTGLNYEDRQTGAVHTEPLAGIFVQIGLSPNSAVGLEGLAMNRFGEILIDEKCRTNIPGVYAAGDVTTIPYKQIVTSMGEGAKAALAAFEARIKGEL